MVEVCSISVVHSCQVRLSSSQPGKHEAWTSMGEDVVHWSKSPQEDSEEEEGEEDSEEDSEEEWHRFF